MKKRLEQNTNHVLVPNDFSKLTPYCSPASIAYLKDSLRKLENGLAPTPTFPLYGKRDDSVLSPVLEAIGNSELPSWFKEYELSRREKFGPQGGVPKWSEVAEDFMLYKTALKPVKYVDPQIMQTMVHEYRQLRCQMLGARATLDHLKRTDKIETRAAGWSEFQLKKTDLKAQQIALQYANNGDWVHGYGYVFTRFNKLKRRIFMPMPFSSMVKQAQWFIPFLGNIQKSLLLEGKRSPFVFWADKVGFENCFQIMEEELNDARLQDDEYVVYFSNDFIKMDTRTGSEQYRSFFLPLLHAAFGNAAMDEAIMFTTTAPIITPAGTLVGDHGTASGAEVTNGGETGGNDYYERRVDKVLQSKLPGQYRLVVRRGNGDDAIVVYFVKKSCAFSTFETALRETLAQVSDETGFDSQLEKLAISTEYGKYCQRVLEYKAKERTLFWAYPIVLVLNSIVHPEREYTKAQWDKDYRDLDIIEKLDNASRHPMYEWFVHYVQHGMKYPLLGASEPETQRILSKYDKYRSLQSLGERYNRQDYEIGNSPTVKLLLRKQ